MRVVVTGIGTINPLGITASESWNNLIQSKSGVKKIPNLLFDTTAFPTKIAGMIPEFNLDEHINPKEQRKMDKFIHFGYAAAVDAVEDSGWKPTGYEEQCRTEACENGHKGNGYKVCHG